MLTMINGVAWVSSTLKATFQIQKFKIKNKNDRIANHGRSPPLLFYSHKISS